MTSLDKLPQMAAETPPGHAEAVAGLQSGAPFAFALADDPGARSVLLQAVIDTAADLGTRFVHVGNPLRSPLTIERVFMQAVGPEADVRLERDAAALTRLLARPVGDETRLVVVVEQSETLDAEALQLLRDMAANFAAAAPRIQFLFSGPTAFASSLQPAPLPAAPTVAKTLPAPVAPAERPVVSAAVPMPVRPKRWSRVAMVTLAAAAVAAVLVWQREPDLLRRAVPPVSGMVTVTPAAAASTAEMQPAVDDTASLRSEFDRFLAERGDGARLSEAGKDELLQEFINRRRARRVSAP